MSNDVGSRTWGAFLEDVTAEWCVLVTQLCPTVGWEDPLEKGKATTPVFLPRESHRQRSLMGYSPRVAKSWTQLSD